MVESTPRKGLHPSRKPSTQAFRATNILVNLIFFPTSSYSMSTKLPGLVFSTSTFKLQTCSKLSSHFPFSYSKAIFLPSHTSQHDNCRWYCSSSLFCNAFAPIVASLASQSRTLSLTQWFVAMQFFSTFPMLWQVWAWGIFFICTKMEKSVQQICYKILAKKEEETIPSKSSRPAIVTHVSATCTL